MIDEGIILYPLNIISKKNFMPKKMKKKGKPNVHEELKGFDIKINALGEMESSFSIDKLNSFLNENTEDKKLSAQDADEEE
jgi:hypothetical protein